MQTEVECNLRKLLKKRERERERRERQRQRGAEKTFNLSRNMVEDAYFSHNMFHNESKTK